MNTKTRFISIAGIVLFLLLATAASTSAQSLWKDDGPRASLISDNVARKQGDILTIIVQESQTVNDKQEVKLEKESDLNSALTSFNIKENMWNPLPDMKQTTTSDFEGKADYKKEGRFEARISATVIDTLPNGNLVIEGRRHIYMDNEEKTIKVTGVVRPLDITTENTIASEKVSDARVSYDGEGELSRSTERSWFDSFLSIIWPF